MKKVFLLLLALTLCFLPAAQAQQQPSLTELLKQYTSLDLTPYLGKTVLVNFFTEWCGFCMQEMPDLKTVHELYDEEAFEMVLVHVWAGEDERNTQNVIERFGMQEMIFFEDTDCSVAALMGLPGYPTTLFITPEGEVEDAYAYMLSLEALTTQLDGMGVPRKN